MCPKFLAIPIFYNVKWPLGATKYQISRNKLNLFLKFKLITKVNDVFRGLIKISTEKNKVKHKILTIFLITSQL